MICYKTRLASVEGVSVFFCRRGWSDGVHAGLAGADFDHPLVIGNKYLAINDMSYSRRATRLQEKPAALVSNDDLELPLGKEIEDVFGCAIKFCVPALWSTRLATTKTKICKSPA